MSSAQHSDDFYNQGKAYWETIPATVDGMLGGFSEISSTDIHSSNRLLKQFRENKAAPLGRHRALDCGAGIGRITKHLLLPLFDTVDMVEQNQAFLDQAPAYIGPESKRVENLFCEGLQDFAPKEGYYDVIWCQWVTGHLTDADLVSFVQRCLRGLRENGIFVLKDNITQDNIDVDNRDGSITRPRQLILQLFEKAGAQVLADQHYPHHYPQLRPGSPTLARPDGRRHHQRASPGRRLRKKRTGPPTPLLPKLHLGQNKVYTATVLHWFQGVGGGATEVFK